MSEREQVTFQTAIAIWECILQHINAGVPVEGLKVIAKQNIEGLKHQVETVTNSGN